MPGKVESIVKKGIERREESKFLLRPKGGQGGMGRMLASKWDIPGAVLTSLKRHHVRAELGRP